MAVVTHEHALFLSGQSILSKIPQVFTPHPALRMRYYLLPICRAVGVALAMFEGPEVCPAASMDTT
jgi:hypothetical protein